MKRSTLFRSLIGAALLFAAAFALCSAVGRATQGPTGFGIAFVVNSAGDGDDLFPGDGQCDTDGSGQCTLRAAIEETNARATGLDGIFFNIPITQPWIINLTNALPNLGTSLNITGPGADKLTVRRGAGGEYRIFNVTTTGTVAFSGLTISNGVSSMGAGINNGSTGTVNVTNCVLTSNIGSVGPGISNNSSGSVNVTNSTISGNQGGDLGGGIANLGAGTVNVTNSTIDGNSVGQFREGGGIYNAGIVHVTGSTLSNNSAGEGGGIFNFGGTATITNSTLSRNFATTTGGGGIGDVVGGILNRDNGTVDVTNSTISGNTSSEVGGIRNNSGTVTVKSSIVALNSASIPDVSGAFTSGGFNFIGKKDGSMGFTQSTDQTGTVALPLDPKLDPNGLQNNGGPTQTIALLFGSPAIDQGTSNGLTGPLTTDQRGFTRAVDLDNAHNPNAAGGDGSDIGAYELQAAPLGNISTRAFVQTGENVLIAGFIVRGSGNKTVLLRALGPTLSNFNITNPLANPILELHNSAGGIIVTNDNWGSAANASSIPTNLRPPNSLESAILISLAPGRYTAILRGVNNGTGVALAEVYDLALTAAANLGNISTRGLVQTGNNVLIGGFIIKGTDNNTVVVRALGPTLANFNIAQPLANPTLELRDVNGNLITSNDNWKSTQQAAIAATGLQPPNDLEAAILRTLTPGNYTAIVRGVNNTTGVALVEVYGLN